VQPAILREITEYIPQAGLRCHVVLDLQIETTAAQIRGGIKEGPVFQQTKQTPNQVQSQCLVGIGFCKEKPGNTFPQERGCHFGFHTSQVKENIFPELQIPHTAHGLRMLRQTLEYQVKTSADVVEIESGQADVTFANLDHIPLKKHELHFFPLSLYNLTHFSAGDWLTAFFSSLRKAA
jgi:hypothetical protein